MVLVMFAWVLQCMHVVACTTTPSMFTCKADMCIPEAIATVDAPKNPDTPASCINGVGACGSGALKLESLALCEAVCPALWLVMVTNNAHQ